METAPIVGALSRLVQIEKPVYGGAFLARVEGKATFVPLTLPGETARIRMVESKAGYATGEAEEIVVAAPERATPGCPHFGACGGCQYQHAGYKHQVAIKKAILRETLERGGVAVPEEIAVLAAETEEQAWGYRNRIRLAFDAQGNPGYRGRRSHQAIAIRECPIAAPLLVRAALAAAEIVRNAAPKLRLKEIALYCNAAETALLASLTTEKPPKGGVDKLALAIAERVPELQGAEFLLEGRGNQPPRTVGRWGATSLAYSAAGFDYRVDHGAFFQVNRWLVDAMVERIVAGHAGALAWDLFAGVGLFARKLTGAFRRVVAVESAPASTQALTANLKGTCGIPVRAATLEFLRRNHPDRPDLIVVDPPRAGLGKETCGLLAKLGAPALAYVSCDPATLARDLHALTGAGYAIESIALADLFPQTFHMETLVQMRKA